MTLPNLINNDWVAIIKLDDFETTKSSGGVVIAFTTKLNENQHPNPRWNNTSGEKAVICKNLDAKIGWIYQDKNHVLRDPNK